MADQNQPKPSGKQSQGERPKEFEINSPKPDKHVEATGDKQKDSGRAPNPQERHPSTISGNDGGGTRGADTRTNQQSSGGGNRTGGGAQQGSQGGAASGGNVAGQSSAGGSS